MTLLPLLVLTASVQAAPAADRAAAYELFLEALALRDAGKTDDAIKTLQRTLKADPRAADAYAQIATIQADQGRFELAVVAINQAIQMAPERPDLRSLAGQIHQFYGQSGGGEGELRLAIREFEEASRLSPGDPAPLRDLTRLYSVLRDAKNALSAWKRLAEADPANPDAFAQVASLSLAAGDTPGAIQALETAVAADPGNARAQQLLGDLKQQTEKPKEALEHYEAAARLDQDDLVTRLKMGDLLIEAHRGADALATADEVLGKDATNRFGLDLKARALKELGRVDEALAVAQGLAASDPKDLKAGFLVVTLLEQKGSLAEAEEKIAALLRRNTAGEDAESTARNNRVFWAHAGMVRQRQGKFKEAADAFGEAAAAGPEKDPALVTYRIDALVSAREFAQALKEARAARQSSPGREDPDLLFLEAYALRGTGDETGAKSLVEGLLATGKPEANTLLAAADFYQRGKLFERAEALYAGVAAEDAKNLRAVFSLGAVRERQKKYDEAEQAFRHALTIEPDSAMALNYLGYMNADRNVRVEEALALIQKAVEKDPDNGSYLDSLAWALHRLGRNEEAEAAIRKALETQEKNAVILAHFGWILAEGGDRTGALKYLRASLEGEDEDGELDRARVEESIRNLSQAAQKKP